MKGEFRIGMYGKILDKNHPNYNMIGLVKAIDESHNDYDVLHIQYVDESTTEYKDEYESDPDSTIKIVLSREYAIDWLAGLGDDYDSSHYQPMTNDEILSEICLSGCVHDSLIDSVFDDVEFKRSDKIDLILKKTGEFRPKKKFLGFVSALKTGIRLISDKATIDGHQLSGMLDGVKLEMTLYSDGTIDLIEIDSQITTHEMIQRLIDDICDLDVTGYAGKFVIHGLTFKVVKPNTERKIKISDNTTCYLEVEHEKPINKLFSLMNETNEPSEKALSILDSLFSDSETTEVENKQDDTQPTSVTEDYLSESFRKMNEEKVFELKDRIEDAERDIHKTNFELKTAEKKIKTLSDNLRVLNTRLESMTPPDDPNGWVFSVSAFKLSGVEIDDKTKEVVSKISPILKLSSDKLLKFLEEGHFTINIGMKDDIQNKEFKLPSDILKKVFSIGTISMISESEYEYRGDFNWHQIVSKMIRMGFEQLPEFEKISGSNSYEVSKPDPILETESDTKQPIQQPIPDGQFKDLVNFDTPTDIVIVGLGQDIEETEIQLAAEFMITDDESRFVIYVDGKNPDDEFNINSMGFGSVMTLENFQKFLKIAHNGKSSIPYGEWFDSELIEGIVIPGFVGKIGIGGIQSSSGQVTSKIDLNDYICHIDGIHDVAVNIPSGLPFYRLNGDLSLPTSILRDIKIDKVMENDNLMDKLNSLEEESIQKPRIYFTLDMDRDASQYWDSGEEDHFEVMVSLDKHDWEVQSEPKWEDIELAVKKSGLVTSYDGFSMESTLQFDRNNQTPDIQNMKWNELRSLIIEKFSNQGWSYCV